MTLNGNRNTGAGVDPQLRFSRRSRRASVAVVPSPSRWVRLWLPIQLVCLAVWLLPVDSQISRDVVPVIRPYIQTLGLQQCWEMFAPNPYAQDVWVSAHMVYADGVQKDWYFPRLEGTSYWERYHNERWRKALESAHQDRFRGVWPSMAVYACNANRRIVPVVSVSLTRFWHTVSPPGVPDPGWKSYCFYRRSF